MKQSMPISTSFTVLLMVAAAGLFCSGIEHAYADAERPAAAQAGGASGAASVSAEKFIREAAMGGMAEVELGRLAQQKTSSNDVRAFGMMMVDDHGKANDELKNIAAAHSVTTPQELDAAHMQAKRRLEALEGAEFDRAYMQQMVNDHRKTIDLFEKAQRSDAADVRQFAEKTLPTLRRHLEQAQKLAGQAGGG